MQVLLSCQPEMKPSIVWAVAQFRRIRQQVLWLFQLPHHFLHSSVQKGSSLGCKVKQTSHKLSRQTQTDERLPDPTSTMCSTVPSPQKQPALIISREETQLHFRFMWEKKGNDERNLQSGYGKASWGILLWLHHALTRLPFPPDPD